MFKDDKIRISVPSYRRPFGKTLSRLNDFCKSEWYVYVYKHDEYLNEYLIRYGNHVKVINTRRKNLPMKRQLIVDDAIKDKVDYLITLDDDVQDIMNYNGNFLSVNELLEYFTKITKNILENVDKNVVQICSSWCTENPRHLYANNAFGSHSLWVIKNMKKAKKHGVKYNENSLCEDIEFSADLIANKFGVYRTSDIVIVSDYAYVNTKENKGGLSYRFKDNRDNEKNYVDELLKNKKYKNVQIERGKCNGTKNNIINT